MYATEGYKPAVDYGIGSNDDAGPVGDEYGQRHERDQGRRRNRGEGVA
jgi:hypothetical protein